MQLQWVPSRSAPQVDLKEIPEARVDIPLHILKTCNQISSVPPFFQSRQLRDLIAVRRRTDDQCSGIIL